jgi:hypothetical protein
MEEVGLPPGEGRLLYTDYDIDDEEGDAAS